MFAHEFKKCAKKLYSEIQNFKIEIKLKIKFEKKC